MATLLGGLTVTEVAQLFDTFHGKTLAQAGVERGLECYIIAKKSKEHGRLLNRPYLKSSEKMGVGYSTMRKAEPTLH